MKNRCLLSILFLGIFFHCQSQGVNKLHFFEPADSFHNGRFWSAVAIGGSSYAATVYGLNEIWYKDFERTSFHFFDDWNEWNNMDKYGHLHTAYFYTAWGFKGARWTGMDRKSAMWTAAGVSFLLQATIETFDAFSAEWGFSVSDMGFNVAGIGAFVLQESLWNEQRISFKFSSSPSRYDPLSIVSTNGLSSTTLRQRGLDLFGSPYFAAAIKDYNAQTYWISVNVASFIKNPETKFPAWLNVAAGVGMNNLFGGFENRWEEDGHTFVLDSNQFPRHNQYFLSLDIDFTKIKTKSKILKTMFTMLNALKVPAPALEINAVGKSRWHWLYW